MYHNKTLLRNFNYYLIRFFIIFFSSGYGLEKLRYTDVQNKTE